MRLTKHHSLGNDFLVLLDLAGDQAVGADLARSVCDRRCGVGADGLLHATGGTGGAHVTMVLYNADGGRAEMSGNGISCLAQAAVLGGAVTGAEVRVMTDAGRRVVAVAPGPGPSSHRMTVSLGTIVVGQEQPEWAQGDIVRAVLADVGNPHLVLQAATADAVVDLTKLGPRINEAFAEGINVEVLRPGPAPGSIAIEIYERGVGLTEACGTGAGASAAAARRWGLAGATVSVHQPGGVAEVECETDGTVRLTVPVVHVATVEWTGT
ncbi:MAG: diaminopimelate epimerase [Acidimicrobiia bacterium]